MGMIRKTISFFSFGLIDMRSDKERIARNTRKAGNKTTRAINKQTRTIKRQG